jgi:penicillin-binding protein
MADPKLDWRSDHLGLTARRALAVNVRRGQRVASHVTAPDEVSGPVKEGEVLGHVTVTVDGKLAASSPLVAAHAVGAATTLDKVVWTAQNPFVLIGLGAIVILVGLLLVRGRRSREQKSIAQRPRAARQQAPRQRTPEERRRMHEERERRRRQRKEPEGGTG